MNVNRCIRLILSVCAALVLGACAALAPPPVPAPMEPSGARPTLVAPTPSREQSAAALRTARERAARAVPAVQAVAVPAYPVPSLASPLWLVSGTILVPFDDTHTAATAPGLSPSSASRSDRVVRTRAVSIAARVPLPVAGSLPSSGVRPWSAVSSAAAAGALSLVADVPPASAPLVALSSRTGGWSRTDVPAVAGTARVPVSPGSPPTSVVLVMPVASAPVPASVQATSSPASIVIPRAVARPELPPGGVAAVLVAAQSCGFDRSALVGYRGPALADGVVPERYSVVSGDSWWRLGRRYALRYADLAQLNDVSELEVASGLGLHAGATAWVVYRRGAERGRVLRLCGAPVSAERWALYPEGVRWRAPGLLAVAGPGDVPALADPHARWVVGAGPFTFGVVAVAAHIPLAEVLAYNGLRPGVGSSDVVRGPLAVPPAVVVQ